MSTTFLELGASLYVPAARKPNLSGDDSSVNLAYQDNLVSIGNRVKYPQLKSVIYDTEDSIRHDQVGEAVHNLSSVLPRLESAKGILRFVRVRNPHVMGDILQLNGVENLDGFVLPKINRKNISSYTGLLNRRDPYFIMPTLETAEVFELREMEILRDVFSRHGIKERILSLRIGGNDLLALLDVRRCPRRTIYDTALGRTISTLVTLFKPIGLNLTGTVFEGLSQPDVLVQEVEQDILQGLFGKTAIHPDQIPIIENQYAVTREELEEAKAILAPDAPAVFKMNDRMCECTVHRGWAESIITRHRIFGLRMDLSQLARSEKESQNGHLRRLTEVPEIVN